MVTPPFSTSVPRWHVALVLGGFPLLYLLNSFAPWSVRLFATQDRSAYFTFYASLMSLHWTSTLITLWYIRRAGLTLADLGLKLSARQTVRIAGRLIAIGIAFVLFRHFVPYGMRRPPWLAFFPSTLAERLIFIVAALSAGFCEELVYRGYGITMLRTHGLPTWLAVLLATAAFALIHGLGGLYAFPVFFLAGLVYANIYLRTHNLSLVMSLHAFYDLTAILVP